MWPLAILSWRRLLRWRRTTLRRRFVCLHFMNIGQLQLSSGNSAPNSGNHHLTIPFEGGMHSFKRRCACKRKSTGRPSDRTASAAGQTGVCTESHKINCKRQQRSTYHNQDCGAILEKTKTETISHYDTTKITTR